MTAGSLLILNLLWCVSIIIHLIILAALTVVYFKSSTHGVHTTDTRNDAHIVNNIIRCYETDTSISDIQYINLWENCNIVCYTIDSQILQLQAYSDVRTPKTLHFVYFKM